MIFCFLFGREGVGSQHYKELPSSSQKLADRLWLSEPIRGKHAQVGENYEGH